MVNNIKIRKILSFLISILMVLGCYTPSILAIDNNQIVSEAKANVKELNLNKIEPELLSDLGDEDLVEVMVYMNSQLDVEMVANNARKSLSTAFTPYQTELQVRINLIETLKDNAENSQSRIAKYLQQEVEKGNVEEFKAYHIVNMIYVKATREIIEKLSNMAEVEKIYKNNIYILDDFKVETLEQNSQDMMLNADGVEWNIERLRAPEVWDLGFDGTGIIVANIDSGVDWTHPALKEKWLGYNSDTGETDATYSWYDPVYGSALPAASGGHGTHVMGTMVGQDPEGKNKIGVAPGAKWIAARVYNNDGYTTDAMLLSAAEWMLAPGGDATKTPKVVNNSWGGGARIDDWYRDAVRAWRAAGIVPVFSAGNQRLGEPAPWPGSIDNPANYPESFAVGAVDINDKLGAFSKLGPSLYDDNLIKPNLSAGGVDIRSSIPGGVYALSSGTSMAAPSVAGAVALIASVNNSLSVDEIEQLLQESARPLSDSKFPESPNMGYGYGFVDTYEAVSRVVTGTGYVSGEVLIEGNDLSAPEIFHEQEVFETHTGPSIEIVARITDDISVVKAEVLVKKDNKPEWNSVPMNLTSGDNKDGMYKGTISANMLAADKVTYKIRATDFNGESVETPEYEINIMFGLIPGDYVQGFENNDVSGWTLTGDWEYGKPENVGPSAFSGKNVVSTKIDGKYSDNLDSWLIAPPIDLRDPNLETASLRFHEWYSIEDKYGDKDRGYLLITDDFGRTWTEVRPAITGDKRYWQEVVVNLDKYIGSQNPILVAFRFTSDDSLKREGWYIDNVRIMAKEDIAPSVPYNLRATSNSRGIVLNWEPSPDGDVSHYNIYRSDVSNGSYTNIDNTTRKYYIDETAEAGNTYYYVIKAVDYSGNESIYSREVLATAIAREILFRTDFENDNGGFITGITAGTSNPWEWGVPESGTMTAYSGDKLWATNLSGPYGRNTDAYIEMPEITIPSDKEAFLHFNHWMDMERIGLESHDYGQILISKDDGATWDNITPGGKYGNHDKKWLSEEISLYNYTGETVKIRFHFHSDFMTNFNGWYIDDVDVMGIEYVERDSSVADISYENIVDEDIITEDDTEEDIVDEETLYEEIIFEENIFDYDEYEDDVYEDIIPVVYELKIEAAAISEGYTAIDDKKTQDMSIELSGIPVSEAIVTIKETGRTIKVDPVTGKFFMRVKEGTYTFIAEAYGYYSEEEVVTIVENQTSNVSFELSPMSTGSISGRVFDRHSDVPIANAVVRIVEDPRIASVKTDENGNFIINNVYEGSYTLKVRASAYESGETSVTVRSNETTVADIGLKKFVSYDNEIAYDDGTDENGMIMRAVGDGLAVRFTPSQYGKVKGAYIHFGDNSWPKPGGNRMGFLVYGLDESGQPYQAGQAIFYDNIIRGEWNFIDLSSFEFSTDEDFYISTIQDLEGSYGPAVDIDEHSQHGDRSYMNIAGSFKPISSEDFIGALMIRAIMEYSMEPPIITNLPELSYTNQDTVLVAGTMIADGKAVIYVNDEEVLSVDTINAEFEAIVPLIAERNEIKVTAKTNGEETEPSSIVVVIKDQVAPELVVTSPEDNSIIYSELVNIKGSVSDNIGLVKLEINNKQVSVKENGEFHERLLLNEGINIFTIKATDLAGNVQTIVKTVIAEFNAPTIKNITPSEDVVVTEGETLTVSFTSTVGGSGYFRIVSPNTSERIAMSEANGVYTGTWTAPKGMTAEYLSIEVIYVSKNGAEIVMTAKGKLSVAKELISLPSNAVIVGGKAYDINYLNNNANAQSDLIRWSNKGLPVYVKISDTIIVTLEGQEVNPDNLEDIIRYYDSEGNTSFYKR